MLGKRSSRLHETQPHRRVVFFNTLSSIRPARRCIYPGRPPVENGSRRSSPFSGPKLAADARLGIKSWLGIAQTTTGRTHPAVWYVFNREKIEFAYPTLTLSRAKAYRAAGRTTNTITDSSATYRSSHRSREEFASRGASTPACLPGEASYEGRQANQFVVISDRQSAVPELLSENSQHVHENDFFGEMSLLTATRPRPS